MNINMNTIIQSSLVRDLKESMSVFFLVYVPTKSVVPYFPPRASRSMSLKVVVVVIVVVVLATHCKFANIPTMKYVQMAHFECTIHVH